MRSFPTRLSSDLAGRGGFADRCEFHAGLVDTLPEAAAFDGATCFLVSQFLLDAAARTAFFAAIAKRLRPAGTLAWADLAWDTAAADYPAMLRLWMQTMSGAGLDADALERVRSEEHTSELQSLMRISYAVFCLKKKTHQY